MHMHKHCTRIAARLPGKYKLGSRCSHTRLSSSLSHVETVHSIIKEEHIPLTGLGLSSICALDPAVYVESLKHGFAKLYKDAEPPIESFQVDRDSLSDYCMQLSLFGNHIRPSNSTLDAGCHLGYMSAVMIANQYSQPLGDHTPGKFHAIDRLSRKADLVTRALGTQLPSMKVQLEDGKTLALSTEVLKHVVVVPSDAQVEGNVGAPYDLIRVGFALKGVDSEDAVVLQKQLRRGGRMVAPVGDANGEQQLFMFEKGQDFKINIIESGYMLKNPLGHAKSGLDMVDYLVDPEEEKLRNQREETRLSERKQVQEDLMRWKVQFEQTNGRKPTRNDLIQDKVASGLFLRFSQLGNPVE